MDRFDLNAGATEHESQVHRSMCNQIFGIDATSLMEYHRALVCGFEIIEGNLYLNSAVFNTSKDGSHAPNGYTDDNVNLGPMESQLIAGSILLHA
jgi:hypothetical protein